MLKYSIFLWIIMVKTITKTMKAPQERKKWDELYNVKTVSAKLLPEDFTKFKAHCDTKGVNVSKEIKRLIDAEVNHPLPANLAGKNIFVYNKFKDNFSWRVVLDNGLRVDIEDDLPAEYVSQLLDSLKQAVDERETYIKKENGGVPIPSKLVRKGL